MHERGRSHHPAAQERQAMEARHSQRDRAQRGLACIQTLRPDDLATMERLPPPKPRRNQTSRDHASHDPAGQWMHCVKLLGQRLAERDFDRQVAEFQVRVAVLNGFTTLGIPVTEVVG